MYPRENFRTLIASLFFLPPTRAARADTVTATIPAGAHPYVVAVNPATNKIYTANYSDNNVTVIDGATNAMAPWPPARDPTRWQSTR